MPKHFSRRQFVGQSTLLAAGLPWWQRQAIAKPERPRARVERAGIASIGMRYQGSVITEKARLYGDIVAIADVDRHVREQARSSFGSTPRIFEDYRDMLDNPAIDVVLIGAPDHWHTQMLIDAVAAGKDVYCEKPLTLTIDEGKVLRDKVGQSKQVVQVGTWQRSDARFRRAVEMVRQGRIGKLRKVTCNTDKNPQGKLRLMYEAFPLAFIVEAAGGAATDGTTPILDLTLTELHQRTPLFIGNRDNVAAVTAALSGD